MVKVKNLVYPFWAWLEFVLFPGCFAPKVIAYRKSGDLDARFMSLVNDQRKSSSTMAPRNNNLS